MLALRESFLDRQAAQWLLHVRDPRLGLRPPRRDTEPQPAASPTPWTATCAAAEVTAASWGP